MRLVPRPNPKLLTVGLPTLLLGFALGWSAGQHDKTSENRVRLPAAGTLQAEKPLTIELPPIPPHEAQMILVGLKSPDKLGDGDRMSVQVTQNDRLIAYKYLHNADPDLFLVLRAEPHRPAFLSIGREEGRAFPFEVKVESVPLQSSPSAVIETEPNDRLEEAVPISLGSTVFASADDRPFIPAPGQSEDEAKAAGVDWYTFRLEGSEPKLVFLSIDLLDREVPVDVALFQVQGGKPAPYGEGFERFEPERSTRFVGLYKFIARRLEPGTYYLRVRGNHPAYQLRTETYPVPPFDPEKEGSLEAAAGQAIRVAMDYIILKGDGWHANTPRVGAVDHRVHNVHAETAQCIACHPTHFSTRGELFTAANGYPVRQRSALLFLTERLYNNPRPFYGHPQAAWARMISASANVLSRLSIMLDLFEKHISERPRTSVHRDVAEYLKLYYKGRSELPADESNGNQPLVSAFEVAAHSWMVFNELHRRTGDEEYALWRDQVRRLIERAPPEKIKDMLDLCYQTIAFCRIDPQGYQSRIKENVEKIFSYQQEDGQWPMSFGQDDPPAEFQTGHCLYTLGLAGVPHTDARIEKAIGYLISRQHAFGAWYDDDDPNQPHPYENFSTPFRETQFAIMALSQYFPGPGGKGWHAGFAPPPEELAMEDWQRAILEMNEIWDTPCPLVLDHLITSLREGNVLVRQQAAAALGRVGGQSALEPLVSALGDPSKLVGRAAAWALRQLGNRGVGRDAVAATLQSEHPLVRRGALQVFAQHHRYWIDRRDIRDTLINERMQDPDPFIRMMSARALWQWWYWDASEAAKSRIEDVYLERMRIEEHPWVQINLKEGFYNICDENTRYLYNNWVALLGRPEDRERAKAGHHASSARQAAKIAAFLQAADREQKKLMLEALSTFHLRTGVYERPGRYHRIGNDVETVQFYPEGAGPLKQALQGLLESEDPELRREALRAGYSLRNTASEDLLGLLYLRALGDSNPEIRKVAREFHREFLPRPDASSEPALVETLLALLQHEASDVRSTALELIPDLSLAPEARAKVAEEVKPLLLGQDPDLASHALGALVGLPSLWRDAAVLRHIAAELGASDPKRRQTALQTVLRVDALTTLGIIRTRLERLFATADPQTQEALLKQAASDRTLAQSARMAALVAEVLQGEDGERRRLALDVVRRNQELQDNAAIRTALAPLLKDPNYRVRQLAESLYSGKKVQYDVDISRLLNYEFFRERVQPIFFRPGRDGKACVECHHNHGILKLTSPKGDLSLEEVTRRNYRSALKVVNLQEPEKSLIVLKPVSTSAAEGVADSKTIAHGGDLRWPDKEKSPQYQTLLAWINGARLE